MKILIINDLLKFGGAEKISLSIKEILSEEYEVFFLSFDKLITQNQKTYYNIKKYNKIDRFIFSLPLYIKIKKILKKIKPDFIIFNNINTSPITILKATKEYKKLQIVHDVGRICPKATLLYSNFTICKGYKSTNCLKQCNHHNSKLILKLKLSLIKRVEKLSKKYINVYVSPSNFIKNILKNYGYSNVYCIPNPIFVEKNKITKKTNRDLFYLGNLSFEKGIKEFVEVIIKNKMDIKLTLAGQFVNDEYKNEFLNLIKPYDNIKYVGFKNKEEIKKLFNDNYCLVVPSIVAENYPTVILEAFMNNTLVIGSNRGGIPELIDHDKLLFDIFDDKSVLKVLNYINTLSSTDYKKIIKSNNNRINNNSYTKYKEAIVKIIMEEC